MNNTNSNFEAFLEKLCTLDKNSRAVLAEEQNIIAACDERTEVELAKARARASAKIKDALRTIRSQSSAFRSEVDELCVKEAGSRRSVLERMHKCSEYLRVIAEARSSISNKALFDRYADAASVQAHISADSILRGGVDYISLSIRINELLPEDKASAVSAVPYPLGGAYAKLSDLYMKLGPDRELCEMCAFFRSACDEGIEKLNWELATLRKQISDSAKTFSPRCRAVSVRHTGGSCAAINGAGGALKIAADDFSKTASAAGEKASKLIADAKAETDSRIDALERKFVSQFPADKMLGGHVCASGKTRAPRTKMSDSMRMGVYEYRIGNGEMSDRTESLLRRHYSAISDGKRIRAERSVSSAAERGCLFRFSGSNRAAAVRSACDLGLGMFMSAPPGQLKATFIDPVTLGESFAVFTRLADPDSRTGEVIGGRIWSNPSDIEAKLRLLTDHIADITQRCLQGKYDSIFEYNRSAEQNAEALRLLMIMDAPAGFSEESLKTLEQIVSSGPKCGVFTVIYLNEDNCSELSERASALLGKISQQLSGFVFRSDGSVIRDGVSINSRPIYWSAPEHLDSAQTDIVTAKLRKAIASADRSVVGIEKVSSAVRSRSSAQGITIPIGVHGAGEIQYLTLGSGSSHHALIAGVAGAGKSTLMHTIIHGALAQYSADELSIYLVDFKRGVEFKIYADFIIPSFKAVALETEREFGRNILLALEREQKIRADVFRKHNVTDIAQYRALGKKMPRIMVIMDEFHELFSPSGDEISKSCEQIMERIVRQGRAFGIHLILASQNYSGISGLNRTVYDQMAVRIVLKCSKQDADLLLADGSRHVDRISVNEPGRAVYNSEAGHREYSTLFRVARIEPDKHRDMLKKLAVADNGTDEPEAKIMLSNIEDNRFCIFNRFKAYSPERIVPPGRLWLGDALGMAGGMSVDLVRSANSNLLMLGRDSEKARAMFSFAMLSLCVNHFIAHRRAPEQPFIYLINSRPLKDSYFADIPALLAQRLPEYIRLLDSKDGSDVLGALTELHSGITGGGHDKYLFVFDYRRSECLRSGAKHASGEELDSIFNFMQDSSSERASAKELLYAIAEKGAQNGVHTVMWQDSPSTAEQDDKELISYFGEKIAFGMSLQELAPLIGERTRTIGENNAVIISASGEETIFRPYRTPDEDWIRSICSEMR